MIAIVDAAALYAAIDSNDPGHRVCADLLTRADLELAVPALVVAEVAFLVGRRLGPRIEARFIDGLASFEVEAPQREDWRLINALIERYADFPLGAADASVVVLAERLRTETIITLDRRHFGALRTRDGRPFQLLPE